MESLLWLFIGLPVIAALWFHRDYYLLQYLFFLRYPLLLALVLLLMPVVAMDAVGAPFRNLFIHERPSMLALVTVAALLVAWETMYLFGFIFEHIENRVDLPFRRKSLDNRPMAHKTPAWLRLNRYRFPIFSILALPVIIFSTKYSVEGQVASSASDSFTLLDFGLGLAAGLVIAVVLIMLVSLLIRFVAAPTRALLYVTYWTDRILFGKSPIETDPEVRNKRSHVFRVNAVFWFAAVTFLVCLIIALIPPEPGDKLSRFDFPAMLYVLLLMMLLGWLLAWLSYLLDRHRMVPEIAMAVLIAIFYNIFDTDHYYTVHHEPNTKDDLCPANSSDIAGLSPVDHSRNRQKWNRLSMVKPVVVAASGGGITAAYWTTVVLGEIERKLTISSATSHGFSDTVHMVSGTSGGSVGLLYYTDAFSEKQTPRRFTERELGWIRTAAGSSSLNAVGWGLVSRDFWRLVFPPLAGRTDRATAMEARWIQGLPANQKRWENNGGAGPVHNPTFKYWQEGVRQGWRPAAVFNSVLVETGELLQITNVELPPLRNDLENTRQTERQFHKLFPGVDIDAVTAARLSATFPWITPSARPDLPDGCENLYHAADGGYYDNFGVISALAYSKALDKGTDPILVEIRASDSRDRPKPESNGGFGIATLGPFKALLAVRGTSQLGRNEMLVEAHFPAERRVVFELRQKTPLSWHLAPRERAEIEAGWLLTHNQQELLKLCRLLNADCE